MCVIAEGSAASFFGKLRALDLPTAEYVVFGSGPLAVRGLIEEVHDLDVVVGGAAWDRAWGAFRVDGASRNPGHRILVAVQEEGPLTVRLGRATVIAAMTIYCASLLAYWSVHGEEDWRYVLAPVIVASS